MRIKSCFFVLRVVTFSISQLDQVVVFVRTLLFGVTHIVVLRAIDECLC